MQNPMSPANSYGALPAIHTAAEPVNHIDGTAPVRADYSSPHPSPNLGKRRNPGKPKNEAALSNAGEHVIDDYA